MTTTRFSLDIPARMSLLPRRGWSTLMLISLIAYIGTPVCALLAPEGSPLHLSAYTFTLVGKIVCYALTTLAPDLVWDYCGILSLDHELFFVLGGYDTGICLIHSIGREGAYRNDLPDFMAFLNWKELPWFWHGTEHFAQAMLLVILVPDVLVWLFGFFAFHSRIKGVYLSIIAQAMTYAAMLLFFHNETGFGGNNGFTGFKRILGFPISALPARIVLFVMTFVALMLALIACHAIVTSKFGHVVTAIHDAEVRVIFSDYNPLGYRLFVWTFSAALCGIAGTLYVPQVGIINPDEVSPGNSVEMTVWVAVGGRGTLISPIVDAFLVGRAKTLLTARVPEYWPFVFGAIFVLVTLYLSNGVLGPVNRLRMKKRALVQAEAHEAVVATGDHT